MTAALVVIKCYYRAPSLWEVFQINQFESDLHSVGIAMVRGGIDLYVVMIALRNSSSLLTTPPTRTAGGIAHPPPVARDLNLNFQ